MHSRSLQTERRQIDLTPWAGKTVIVYDGDCPFCSRYVRYQRLRETVGPVDLIDARKGADLVRRLADAGYDLDDGMVLIWQGQIHHGDDCIHRLALLSTKSGIFNTVNAAIFRSRTASRLLYPLLRACRNAVLRLLGRRKIADALGLAPADRMPRAGRPQS